MLIEFKVSNYRSIGEEQIMSLIPAPKQKDYINNILISGRYEGLNAIAIYGANGSGKSNLLLAMGILDDLVHLSSRFSSITKLPFDPFLLRKGWSEKPTCFEITFILDGNKYRYGLEYNQDVIEKEWLYRKASGREVNVFLRERDIIDPSSTFKANAKVMDAAIEVTKSNSLFLSSCDMMNIGEAKDIIQWFRRFTFVDGIHSEDYSISTIELYKDLDFRNRILEYMLRMGVGIAGIELITKQYDENDISDKFNEGTSPNMLRKLSATQNFEIKASHFLYNEKGDKTDETISWKFDERESNGTNKALHLSGPILWTLKSGGVLIIDEIEAKMHPLMTLDTINMFLDKELNTRGAQLVFATHDTNLLSYANLRRDQIYFAEKNNWESTEIYSLSDFVYVSDIPGSAIKERGDTDKEKRYFEGRYGAVPTLGKFKLFEES